MLLPWKVSKRPDQPIGSTLQETMQRGERNVPVRAINILIVGVLI